MRAGPYERGQQTSLLPFRFLYHKEVVLTKIPVNSSTLFPASQGRQASMRDSEPSSAPPRRPYHSVLMTPAATSGEPSGVACGRPAPVLGYIWPMRVFSALIQVLASQLLASKLGGVAMVTPQAWIPRDTPCILRSLPR